MKLRFLLVSALALAFMVPAALANDTTGEAPVGDDTTKVDDTTHKDGVADKTDKATKTDQAKHDKKAKKRDRVKKHAMRDLCRPRVGVVVRGELVEVDAVAGTFTVLVDRANRHGKRFVGYEATFKLANHAKVRKHGKASLLDVQTALEATPGYRVKVMGRACKSEIKAEIGTPELYTKHVKVKAPKTDEAKDGDEKTEEPKDESTDETKTEESTDTV